MQTQSSRPIIVPPPRLVRACLAPLLSCPSMSPKEELDWSEFQIKDLGGRIVLATQRIQDQARLKKEETTKIFVARYEQCCILKYVEDRGLFHKRDFQTLEAYLAFLNMEWPGVEVCPKQQNKYFNTVSYVPEHVALSGKAGITLLNDVGHAQYGSCVEMLGGLILLGTRAARVRFGAKAAARVRRQGGPEAVALLAARVAVDAHERGGKLKAQSDEELLTELLKKGLGLGQLLIEADARGLTGPEIEEARGMVSKASTSRPARRPADPPDEEGSGGSGSGGEGQSGPAGEGQRGRSGEGRAESRKTDRTPPPEPEPEPPEPVPPGPRSESAEPVPAETPKQEPVPAETSKQEPVPTQTGAEPVPTQTGAEPVPTGTEQEAADTGQEEDENGETDQDAGADDGGDDDGGDDDGGDDDDDGGDDDGGDDDDGGGGDDDDGGGGDDDGGDEDEEPPAPAKPPERLAPHQECLPVPYPGTQYHPTQAERHACGAIISLTQINYLVRPLLDDWGPKFPLHKHLQLHVTRAIAPLERERSLVLPLLEQDAREGKAYLDQFLPPQGPPDLLADRDGATPYTEADLWLVPLGTDDFVPMTYLTYEVLNPIDDPEPNALEVDLHRFMGLLECCRRELVCFRERFTGQDGQDADPVAIELLFQLQQLLEDSKGYLGMLCCSFRRDAQLAIEEEAETNAELEVRQKQADQSMIWLGCDRPPRQYVKLGVSSDGRHVALTQSQALVIVAVGPQGVGKTQTGVNVGEGVHLHLPGLNRMDEFGRSYTFSSSWRQGSVNRQHLRGLEPNPYADQWRYLRDTFRIQVAPHNAAHKRIVGMCLPGSLLRYQGELSEERERGLQLMEIGMGPGEWGSFSYRMMLPGSAERGAKGKAQWRTFIDSVIGYHGQDATPELIAREFDRAKLRNVNKDVVLEMLRALGKLTYRDGRQLADTLQDMAPYLVLLEDAFLGPDMLLPLEVAMINALSRLVPGDPLRWFFMHEMGKRGMDERLGPFMKEVTGEVRHRPCSYYIETHLIGDLHAGVVSLASGILHFRATNLLDYRKVQNLCPGFREVDFRVMKELARGRAYEAFQMATDPGFVQVAQEVILRPSCVWAGGETVATGRPEE